MADLIERSAAIDKMCGDCKSGYDGHCPHPHGMCHECESIWETPKADIPAVSRWIPCSERLPEQTGYYLVCDSTAEFDNIRGRQDVSKYVIGRHGGHWYGAIRREHITHWIPLPDPPEGGAGDD